MNGNRCPYSHMAQRCEMWIWPTYIKQSLPLWPSVVAACASNRMMTQRIECKVIYWDSQPDRQTYHKRHIAARPLWSWSYYMSLCLSRWYKSIMICILHPHFFASATIKNPWLTDCEKLYRRHPNKPLTAAWHEIGQSVSVDCWRFQTQRNVV